jgi:hypothetical protein
MSPFLDFPAETQPARLTDPGMVEYKERPHNRPVADCDCSSKRGEKLQRKPI